MVWDASVGVSEISAFIQKQKRWKEFYLSVSRHRRTNRYFKSWTKKTLTRRRPVQTPSCTVGLINEFTRWNIITDSKRGTSPVSPPCDRVCSSLCCVCCEKKPQSCRPPTFDPWPAHWPPHQPGSGSRWTHADVHTHTHTIFCSYQTSSQKFYRTISLQLSKLCRWTPSDLVKTSEQLLC